MAQTVIGMFDSTAEAQQAVENLVSKGFSRDNIDVANSGSGNSSSAQNEEHEESGVTKFFKSLFSNDDDDDSRKYTTVAKRSGSVVTVHVQSDERAEDAADIMDDAGAVDVDERAATYGFMGSERADRAATGMDSGLSDTYSNTTADVADGYTDTTPTGDVSDLATSGMSDNYRTTSDSDTQTGDMQKIPIIEENLQVGKREVLTGGKRLRSRIVERPVEESLRLREENVRVERTAVDREATSDDLANFKGTHIEMTERAEIPVVSKQARVVEEVSLGKDVEERTHTVSDTVRKTEVDIENIEADDNDKF